MPLADSFQSTLGKASQNRSISPFARPLDATKPSDCALFSSIVEAGRESPKRGINFFAMLENLEKTLNSLS
jgi:hypothetical protein